MPFKNPHPLYKTWVSMKQRCYNPNNPSYAGYGGRGIYVCDRWLNDFHAFTSDMGERPPRTSLDRIDNDGPYSPNNCRWATKKAQQRNRRDSRYVTIDGIEYKAVELAEKIGVKTDTIVERVNRGCSMNKIMSSDKLHNLDGLRLGAEASSKARKSRTHCRRGHEYTPENTEWQKNGSRTCKACRKLTREARKDHLA